MGLPSPAGGRVEIEQESEVRRATARGDTVELPDALQPQLPTGALVGGGGVHESVAQHDGATGQGGLDIRKSSDHGETSP